MPTCNEPNRGFAWWMAEYIVLCEAGPEVRGRFESHYRDQLKHQGPDDSVFGRVKSPRNVDIEHAHLVSELDWETGWMPREAPSAG